MSDVRPVRRGDRARDPLTDVTERRLRIFL